MVLPTDELGTPNRPNRDIVVGGRWRIRVPADATPADIRIVLQPSGRPDAWRRIYLSSSQLKRGANEYEPLQVEEVTA